MNAKTETAIPPIFVIPMSDEEVRLKYPQFADRLAPWRKLACSMGYGDNRPLAWLIRPGFTLKIAPSVGPCYQNLKRLDWDYFPDEPTEHSLVFWIPRLASKSDPHKTIGTDDKKVCQMVAYRAEIRRKFGLPDNHATTFGSIELLFALILANFKISGEVEPGFYYAVSDTLLSGAYPMLAGGFVHYRELICKELAPWSASVSPEYVGFFFLGVEKLDQPASRIGE